MKDTYAVEPTVIIPGVQKSGTSTLYTLLGAHPEICASSRSETEYFTGKERTDLGTYERFFVNPAGRWKLDVSPGYFICPNAPFRIAAALPDVKLIFIFREPVARAYSAWQMQQTKGSDLRPFFESIRDSDHYVKHGQYATHLRRFLEVMSIKQMLFLRMEDLSAECSVLEKKVASFLGIGEFPKGEMVLANLGGVPRSRLLSRGLNLAFRARNALGTGPFGGFVSHPLVDRTARQVRNRIATWNRVSNQHRDTGPDYAAVRYLAERFEPEVEDLAGLTGLDLRGWGQTWQR